MIFSLSTQTKKPQGAPAVLKSRASEKLTYLSRGAIRQGKAEIGPRVAVQTTMVLGVRKYIVA
jgi:hypothetical protein